MLFKYRICARAQNRDSEANPLRHQPTHETEEEIYRYVCRFLFGSAYSLHNLHSDIPGTKRRQFGGHAGTYPIEAQSCDPRRALDAGVRSSAKGVVGTVGKSWGKNPGVPGADIVAKSPSGIVCGVARRDAYGSGRRRN